MAYCNKCGYMGDNPTHNKPNGDFCTYEARTIFYSELTDYNKPVLIETVTTLVLVMTRIDPNKLIDTMLNIAPFDIVIEILQLCIERGHLTLDSGGYVISTAPPIPVRHRVDHHENFSEVVSSRAIESRPVPRSVNFKVVDCILNFLKRK